MTLDSISFVAAINLCYPKISAIYSALPFFNYCNQTLPGTNHLCVSNDVFIQSLLRSLDIYSDDDLLNLTILVCETLMFVFDETCVNIVRGKPKILLNGQTSLEEFENSIIWKASITEWNAKIADLTLQIFPEFPLPTIPNVIPLNNVFHQNKKTF